MQRDYSPRQRHRHHHRRHKSRRRSKSRMNGTKEEIPSPLRPPTSPQPPQQPSSSIAVTKGKTKDDKESAEITSTIQSKASASAEVGTKVRLNYFSFLKIFKFEILTIPFVSRNRNISQFFGCLISQVLFSLREIFEDEQSNGDIKFTSSICIT